MKNKDGILSQNTMTPNNASEAKNVSEPQEKALPQHGSCEASRVKKLNVEGFHIGEINGLSHRKYSLL